MLHFVSGIYSVYLFVNLILVTVSLFPTYLLLHPSLRLLTHHSDHPLLHLSFTPGFKPTCFTNATPHSFTSSSRTAFTDSVFLFSFFVFFVSVPCARLSLPSRQLLSARNLTVSYRIVLLRPRKGCASIVMSMSMCVSVCPRRYRRIHTRDLYQICCACYLWPWLCPPPASFRLLCASGFVGDIMFFL